MVGAVCLRLVYLAALSMGCSGEGAVAEEPPAPPLVELETAAHTTWVPLSSATARIRARRSVTVRAETSGRVADSAAHVGTTVEEGDLLLRVYSSADAAEAAAAAAVVFQARARHESAERVLETNETLAESGSVTPAELDEARTEESVARGELREARARTRARRHEASSSIRAAFSGTVSSWSVEDGEYVQAGAEVAKLEDMSGLVAEVWVASSPQMTIEPEGTATIRVSALGPRVFEATVSRVSPVADSVTGRTYVELTLDNSDGALRPGTVGRAEIPIGTPSDVVTVPTSAVTQRFGQDYVYIIEGNVARLRAVTLGEEHRGRRVVEDGLAVGERFVARGAARVSDGQPVSASE